MKKIRLIKLWEYLNGENELKTYQSGSVMSVDEKTAAHLIEKGIAEEYDEEALIAAAKQKQKEEEEQKKSVEQMVVTAVKETLPTVLKESKQIQVVTDEGDEGFKSIGEQMLAVKEATLNPNKTDKRLLAIHSKAMKDASGLSEGIDSEGGFLVQTDFQQELEKMAHETGKLVQRTRQTPISSNANGLVWNEVDESSRATGSRRGGIRVYREHEADTVLKSKPKFRRQRLDLEKMAGLFYTTEELLQDSAALGSMVSEWFGEEFGFKMDDEIIRGTGAGEMLGILKSDARVVIAKESSQAADTIQRENIEKMWTSMFVPSLSRAIWYINQEVYPQLFQMKLSVGTGGVPVFMPPSGISQAPYGTLFGRPVEPIEQCSALGDEGDIIFCDLSQYRVIEKGGVQASSSIHVRFVEGETAFRFTMRNNGQPAWKTKLTPYKGSITISPFIVLAERA